LERTVTNQNLTHEEIKRILNLVNACYNSVWNRSSSCLLSKKKIKIFNTVILFALLYGCETWPLTLREENRLEVTLEHSAEDEITEAGENCIMRSFITCMLHKI
jgi:hypothetical protein